MGTCTQLSDECQCDIFRHADFTIGGKVEGLPRGAQVTLQDTFGGQPQIAAPNGAFTFPNSVPNGTAYFVQVANPQPAGESCHLQNGVGNVRNANVTNIVVDCSPQLYTIGGQVQGLPARDKVKLRVTLTGTAIVEPDIDVPKGSFSFKKPVPSGTGYDVQVVSQPAGVSCTPAHNNSHVGDANVTNIVVDCSQLYTIGGQVQGLPPGEKVTLQAKLTGASIVESNIQRPNGAFVFQRAVPSGTHYDVQVVSPQPTGVTCTATPPNNTGQVGSANVTNIVVNCSPVPGAQACDSNGCIWVTEICPFVSGKLKNNVVGFTCVAGQFPPVSGGDARTAADAPETSMSATAVANIGSLSKTITAVAILQLLAQNNLSINQAIGPYLYPDWSPGPYVAQVTFQQLMNHTSGFGQLASCGNTFAYADVRALVATGLPSAPPATPWYGNCNFSLLRELMPALLGISLVSLPDPQRAQVSSSLYINDVNTNVLQPVGIPAAECEPPGAPGAASEMLSYPFPPDSTPGTDWGSSMSTCGAGGWELSADSVFSVVNDLATGNILLTAGQKQQMITDCLGWDCSVRTDCPNPSVGTGPYVCKNGNPGDSGVNPAGPACTQQYETMWTYAGILTNVPVVVFVNSPLPYPYTGNNSYNCPYTGDIIDLVRDAYCAAGVSGPPAPCQP